ncbi:MAG: carbohydrate kinase [Clostridia bacterium]|nr:carbohydrate kinase [Clostridia bacterium]
MKVLSFGEILWDIYPGKKYIGGAPFNFAAHLAKHGEEAYMLSCLGNDDLGEEALLRLKEFGVLTDCISRSAVRQTGQCLVTLDENAVPSYDLKQDVAYDYIDCDNLNKEFDVLYFGTLALRNKYNLDSLCKLLKRQKFKEVFVDVNIRAPFYSYESVAFCITNATILKVSSEELPIIADLLSIDSTIGYKEFARLLKERYSNLRIIVITLGADGAYCYDCRKDKEYSCESQKVEVDSTVGAGDSFSAAFLYQYSRKKDIQFSLDYASKIAGYVVSKYDAVPDYSIHNFI